MPRIPYALPASCHPDVHLDAASLGAEEVGLRLLDAGARPELRGLFGETALHWAALRARIGLAARLIKGSVVNLKDEKYNSSPLGWAIYGCYNSPTGNHGRQREVVALLVRAGAQVESAWLESERVREEPSPGPAHAHAAFSCTGVARQPFVPFEGSVTERKN